MQTPRQPVDIPIAALHKTLIEIAEVCGIETVIALHVHFGGVRIYIPRTYRAGHDLEIIGADRARALCEYFSGSELTVPVVLMSPDGRRKAIRELDRGGASQRDIARRLGCSLRVVRDELWRRSPRVPGRRTRKPVETRQFDLEEWLASQPSR